jgi:arylsulfatase A-like enzyme
VSAPGRRPNILLVISDQLRRHALGCYGDPNISTPHLDRLAAEGVRFANSCVTYPVCVPSRFTLMTGQHAHSRLVPAIGWRMSPAERTIAHELGDAGYQTAYVGKWHLFGAHPGRGRPLARKRGLTPIPRPFRGGFECWRAFEFRNDPFV